MYRGEFQLGDLLTLELQTVGDDGIGVEPDDAPTAIVCSSTGQVESHKLPITDERNVDGRFWHCISLDSKYSEGQYWIQYLWEISSTVRSSIQAFRIVAGGNTRGTGISMEHFRRPPNDFILLQTDGNLLLKKKNPAVST